MDRSVTRRLSPATVISLIALFVALGGTSYAALSIPRNSRCGGRGRRRRRHRPAGPAGLSAFARVDQLGGLHQHSAGVTSTKDPGFTGVYYVDFTQDISACAAVVSQGETTNNGFIPGTLYEAVVQSDPNNTNNPHRVAVFPTDTSGSPKNAGFDLVLAC